MKSEYRKGEVEFKVNEKKIQFVVYHNLPDQFGCSLESAVINWSVRTDEHTAESLCRYIKSKQSGFVAMTEADFEKYLMLMERLEISKSGYGGILPSGEVVDVRLHPDAVRIQKNELFGVPEPKKITFKDGKWQ